MQLIRRDNQPAVAARSRQSLIGRSSRSLSGTWSLGERWLSVDGELVWTAVWLHLLAGGQAILSVRRRNKDEPDRCCGRWGAEGVVLHVAFGRGAIRATYSLEEDVLFWAGEVLLRQPHVLEIVAVPPGRRRLAVAGA